MSAEIIRLPVEHIRPWLVEPPVRVQEIKPGDVTLPVNEIVRAYRERRSVTPYRNWDELLNEIVEL